MTTITTGGSAVLGGNQAYDTVLAVYTGTVLSNLTQVACNDNYSGLNLLSAVIVKLNAGIPYYIQVGSYNLGNGNSIPGNLELNVNAAVTTTPSIGVTPASGQYQQTLTVTGTKYLPNEPVNVFFGPLSSWAALYTVNAGSTGTFSLSFPVPVAAYGVNTITAVGQASTKRASAQFTVNPLVTLNKGVATAGSSVVTNGYGFGSKEVVQAHWGTPGGLVLGTATTVLRGSFSTPISFTVPISPAGTYSVFGVGLSSGAVTSTTLQVR
jgi:hypothetical protein